jgi:hypothetical protein
MPSTEEVAQELGKGSSIDDFYGKDGTFVNFFIETFVEMLKVELTSQLGYEPPVLKTGGHSGMPITRF